jgi:hypothetical protein
MTCAAPDSAILSSPIPAMAGICSIEWTFQTISE